MAKHAGLIFAALPIALLVLRIAMTSQGDAAVAAALVANAELTTLLVFTLIQWVGVIIFVGSVALIMTRGMKGVFKTLPETTRYNLVAAWWSLAGLYIATRPWTAALASVGILAAYVLLWMGSRRLSKRRTDGEVTSQYLVVEPAAFIFVLVPTLVSPALWLPMEEIQVEAGTTQVGYVLDQTDVLTVVRERGGLIYISDDKVKSRMPCVARVEAPSVVSLVLDRDHMRTAKCPSLK
ncbi:MAG: hypothetical protein WAW88_01080 [Nocardioides sp.]